MVNNFFSIVVVSLNTKFDFLKTLSSIEKQTYKNYEIVIVDGKSNDGTVNEIKKIKNKKVRFIIEKDKGIYDAMNKGIRKSQGKWIIFLNSGDVFYNHNVLKKISKKKLKGHDIVFGDTVIDNQFFDYRQKAQNFTKKTILMPFCHQSVLVKKKLLLKLNFLLKYKIASDFDFFMRSFIRKFSFYNLKIIVSKTSSNGLSDNNRDNVYNENIKIIKANNYNLLLILKLLVYKNFNFFKDLIRFFLPHSLILFILRVKYNKNFKSKQKSRQI